MIKIVRALAWITLLAIAVMTLSPIADRPHPTSDPHVEKAAAFVLLGLLFFIGYRRSWPVALAVVLVAACGLEAAQLLTPDRDATIIDAFLKVAGAIAGFGIGLLLSNLESIRKGHGPD